MIRKEKGCSEYAHGYPLMRDITKQGKSNFMRLRETRTDDKSRLDAGFTHLREIDLLPRVNSVWSAISVTNCEL